MTTWNEVRRVRKELAEAIQVDCDLLEKQGQIDPWEVLNALDSAGEVLTAYENPTKPKEIG